MSRLETLTKRKMAISPSEEDEYSLYTCVHITLPRYSGKDCLWQLMGNPCVTCFLRHIDAFKENTGVLDE